MKNRLYIATRSGLVIACRNGGTWNIVNRCLQDQALTSVVVCDPLILVGTSAGVLHSRDGGKSWTGAGPDFPKMKVRWLSVPARGAEPILAGTEPAAVLVSHDGSATWQRCVEVEKLRDAHGWMLPYSPEAGCVRGFAVSGSGARARAYAAVEVGGALRSDNGGRSWRLVSGSDGNPDWKRSLGTLIHPDVHSIAVHPSSADLVTAPTGGGLYRSADGGTTWSCLYDCYCRAAWVDPKDARHIILGPADGVSQNGRIEVSQDGGRTWHPASEDLKVPWPKNMVERFYCFGHELLAVLAGGELLSTNPDIFKWQRLMPEAGHVTSVAAGK